MTLTVGSICSGNANPAQQCAAIAAHLLNMEAAA
jgi:hypothetical protein